MTARNRRRWALGAAAALVLAGLLAACGDAAPEARRGATATATAGDSNPPAALDPAPPAEWIPIDLFLELFHPDRAVGREMLDEIFADWHPAYAAILVEATPYSAHRVEILERLSGVAGVDLEGDIDRAYRWLWAQPPHFHPDYDRFKAILYRQIDPRFASYFDDGAGADARIRLDEIRWGGVRRDGIPPLDRPTMIAPEEASYLDDADVVFGIEVAGDARAYPKRILAWHEMVKDVVGGASVNGVYCTLCGTMILYRTEVDGRHHELGTSGFLYRSNKLMYDHATESLWSTIHGEPVLGPLATRGVRLAPLSVVTTTWGHWRALHPETRVLSLDTGYDRDYAEGAAYREYFATDALMFDVPFDDRRLRNKDEVLALRFGEAGSTPTAIVSAYLRAHPVFHGRLGATDYVVLTDASGAHRVFDASGLRVTHYDGDTALRDAAGDRWRVAEDALVGASGARRPRLAAHRAFWFGWHAAHPDTDLVGAPRSAEPSAERDPPLPAGATPGV